MSLRVRLLLAMTGRPIVGLIRWILAAAGMAAAVCLVGAQPASWRAPVKAEFMRTMTQAGVSGLRAAMISGALFGVAMVMQASYWLSVTGQLDLVGRVLVLLLIREVAPVIMGLILVGRSATAMMIDLSLMRRDGQVRMLALQGIDPFRYLVMPRVVALALSQFSLTIVFVVTALVLGHLFGYALGVSQRSLFAFLDTVLQAMTATDFVILPLKTLTIGFALGIVSTLVVFDADARHLEVRELITRGFFTAVLAVFLISGLMSVLL
ncbi:MAG: ABC transporter permease [Rhodospirillales bacterium]|nr:ABC transporter permease [Rhodospirillales bacterium]